MCHHISSAKLGDVILGVARPLHVGKSSQMWEIRVSRSLENEGEEKKVALLAAADRNPGAKNSKEGRHELEGSLVALCQLTVFVLDRSGGGGAEQGKQRDGAALRAKL
jgi:acyl-coenzyme A thioesterase PaaI-like protein